MHDKKWMCGVQCAVCNIKNCMEVCGVWHKMQKRLDGIV